MGPRQLHLAVKAWPLQQHAKAPVEFCFAWHVDARLFSSWEAILQAGRFLREDEVLSLYCCPRATDLPPSGRAGRWPEGIGPGVVESAWSLERGVQVPAIAVMPAMQEFAPRPLNGRCPCTPLDVVGRRLVKSRKFMKKGEDDPVSIGMRLVF